MESKETPLRDDGDVDDVDDVEGKEIDGMEKRRRFRSIAGSTRRWASKEDDFR